MIETIPTVKEQVTTLNPETGRMEFDRAKFRAAAEKNRTEFVRATLERRRVKRRKKRLERD